MKSYADQPQDIRKLVEPDRVHRDVYLSPELFALEQQHFFANTWTFVAHASQLPQPGDYITLDIAGRPLLVIRQADASIRVFYNRCAHKGAKVAGEDCGNAGKFLRCPYHAWTYKLDGAPLAVPLKSGYEGTGMTQCESGRGMTALQHVEVYRDFVFVKLNDGGPDFKSYFGEALGAIDNMVDRSPTGQLQVAGGVLRNVIHCNWRTSTTRCIRSPRTSRPCMRHKKSGPPSPRVARSQWRWSKSCRLAPATIFLTAWAGVSMPMAIACWA